MKKILFLTVMIILIISSFTVVSGMPKGVPFDKISKNDQTFYEYTKSNLLLTEEVDRVRELFKELGKSLNARVNLDETDKTIKVIKPNIQMITAREVGIDTQNNDSIVFKDVFGKVRRGDKLDRFKVYTEIDELPSGNKDFRLLITAPDSSSYATDEFIVSPEIASIDKTEAYITFDVGNANFSKAGAYHLKLQMKLEGESAFFTVAEKKINASR